MGRGRRWLRGLLAVVVSFTLTGTAFAAPGSSGKPSAPANQALTVSAVQPGTQRAQVDPSLESLLAGGGQQTFLVKLNAQADITGAAGSARTRAAKAGGTPAAQRLAQATAVIQSLKATADRGQAGLVRLLDTLKQGGAVSSYERFWIVNGIAVTGNARALQALAARPEVASIAPSKSYHLLGGPSGTAGEAGAGNAPSAVAPDGGGSIASIEWNIARINAPQAWDLGIDGTGVVVANLDTGVDGTHPALARKWRGADGSDPAFSWFDAVNNNNTAPYDDHGHGTHTMGTIAGSDESGTNQIGVAPGAKWIAAKILNAGGSGTDVDIIEAGQWLLAPGGDPSKAPDVVSNSWGGGPGLDEWFRPTVQAWRAAGIVPVFAAGNDGPGAGSVSEPGNYPENIAVGAVNNTDGLASFSGRGPSPYGETKPEISAPGVGIRSSVPGGGYEGGWSGTSMATPHVAGVAALLRQANASLTVDDIEAILTSTATPRTDSQYTDVPNNGYGWGIVNAFDAVSAVLTGRGTVQGRVVTSGDDLEPPAISHTPITDAYAGFDVPISAAVTDNVSLTEVSIYAKMAGDPYYTVIPMQQQSGDYKGGTYRGVIPGYLVQVPSLEYYIRAVDYGNNPVTTPVASVAVSRGVTPGWSSDLETEPVGWQHGGNNDPWQWGTPTSGPGAAHSGSNLWATNLAGPYGSNTNAYLLMPPLDLTGETGAALDFWHWYEFENRYDHGDVFVSTDYGSTWTMLAGFTGTGTSWQKTSINLTPYAGQVVLVLFNLFSDGSITKAGWYIDDLTLNGPDAVPPAAPTGLQGSADALGAVTLAWDANTEPDLGGYRVYRSATSGSGYTLLGSASTNGFIDSNPPQNVPSYYVVTALDIWGNESAYSAELAVTPQGPVTLFFDDMESGEGGWTHGGTQDLWQHGTPTSGPSGAFSGTNAWATNLAGNYNSSTNAWLMSAPITLTGVSAATLQFAQWYYFENNYDKGYVEISSDGGSTWTQLGSPFTGGPSAGWLQPTYDLSAYVGQTVQLRFRMTSDSSVNYAGWYIDDVKVVGTAITGAADGAWIPEKPAEKLGDATPLYRPSQPGTYKQASPEVGGIGIMSLPVDATITILETGRSVRTDPGTGTYTLKHAAGVYTARAESYGYYPVDATVDIPADGTVTQNFSLQPKPWGIVTGTVINARTGEPLAGARVEQLQDLRVAPATTGADGSYQLSLLVGSYTLKVSTVGFKPFTTTINVGEGAINVNAALEPFIGFPGELAYDDGSGENAYAYYDANNGWAVRMTPDPVKGPAMLSSASFFLWDVDWPTPGGDDFAVAVYDASGPDGSPGKQVAGPINVTGTRGTWNTVDLSSLGLQFTGDFYVTYVQTGAYPNVPGLATDEGTFFDRSWQLVGGQWTKTGPDEGNRMIRATVLYEVMPPAITSPVDGLVTNQADVTVQGTAVEGATVKLFNNGVEVSNASVAGGQFAIPTTLTEGGNSLTMTATVAAGETRGSAPVVVTLDTVLPVLDVSSPADGLLTNQQVLTVTGTVADDHLKEVTVNGQAVTVADGSFSQRIILDEGSNTVTVVATDLAGNSTTTALQVTLDTAAPTITNVKPDADVSLESGQTLTVSFDSETGLTQVGYRIMVAGTPSNTPSASFIPNMTETSPGHYEGTYTAPNNTSFSGASITVWAFDAAGNSVEVAAAGKLSVVNTNQAPTAVITPPKNVHLNRPATFDGNKSTDLDGTIVSYHWVFVEQNQTADGATATFTYTQKGTYHVTLTVTDDKGATNTTTVTVAVK